MHELAASDLGNLQEALDNYQPSHQAIELIRHTPILLLVGISGAGKDSIKHRLLATGQYHHIISHTTRPPRANQGVQEQDGVDYHFIDIDEAIRMVEARAFVEAKMYSGNVYGTSVAEIQKAHDIGKIAVTDLEVQGVAEYKELAPEVMAAFIVPPSFDVWRERFDKRYGSLGTDQKDQGMRMRTAVTELETALEAGYFCFVINDELDKSTQEVDAIAHSHASSLQERRARELAMQLLQEMQGHI